jgi:hypothetical protein
VTLWLAVTGASAPASLTAMVMVGYVVGRQDAGHRRRLAEGVWLKLTEPDPR